MIPWERYEARGGWFDGSGSCQTQNRHDSCHTITDNIGRVYVDSWYHPQTITYAARHCLRRQWSNEALFGGLTVIPMNGITPSRGGTQFATKHEIEPWWTHQLVPLHIASLAHYVTEIRFRQRNGDSSRVMGGTDSQRVKFDNESCWKAIHVPSWQCVIVF